MWRGQKDIFTSHQLINLLITKLFVEQPLILPRSAKYKIYEHLRDCNTRSNKGRICAPQPEELMSHVQQRRLGIFVQRGFPGFFQSFPGVIPWFSRGFPQGFPRVFPFFISKLLFFLGGEINHVTSPKLYRSIRIGKTILFLPYAGCFLL